MSKQSHFQIRRRPRRLRRSQSVRELVQENHLRAQDLIQPVFVIEGQSAREPIESMPGVGRLGLDALFYECEALVQLGVRAVALFPCVDTSLKNDEGDEALNCENLILRRVRELKARFPELLIIADIALDPYTTHGHDGILSADGNEVDNDLTVEKLAKMAVLHAQTGVDWVAPSDMMDGRVGVIREMLDDNACEQTAILAYSAKYASAYYGPFRDAVGSSQAKPISKSTYQLNPANRREALLETMLDTEEGADVLMVKPAGAYLDIIRDLRERSVLPIAAYQVSGEFAQIHAASQQGWLDYHAVRDESLMAIKRAGADMILTYFAREVAASLQG